MARARTYQHDIRCPHCGSNWMPRDGLARGRQAYRCGDCRRRHVPGGAFCCLGPAVKEQALTLYTEGSSLSATGRVLG